MDPVSVFAGLSLGTTLLGGVSKAKGEQQSAQAIADAYNYKAAVAENNRITAEQMANYELGRGQYNAQLQTMKTGDVISKQVATQAAKGFDVNTGTNVRVREGTAQTGMLDALTLLNNAQMNAFKFKTDAANFQAEAGLDRMIAANARKSAKTAMTSSLIGTAGSFADKWLTFKRVGVFG